MKNLLSLLLGMMLMVSFLMPSALATGEEAPAAAEAEIGTAPHTRPDGGKYRIAFVDYDEYLIASRQFYYILKGLEELGWFYPGRLPFTLEEIDSRGLTTENMVTMLAKTDLGPYLSFDDLAFFYLSYDDPDRVAEELTSRAGKGIDLIITFGTSAGVFVSKLNLSVPMFDFSATDPVASGIITLFSRGLDIGVSNERPTEYLPAAPELVDNSNNGEYFRYNMELADWVFESLFTVLEEENPDLTMVNIQSTDYIAHRFGPESKEMDECLSAVDERLGELFRKMESAGMLEHTALIITADHGMTPSDKAIPLNALSFMNFPGAGSVVDGRNGYIWYGNEDREAVIRFYVNIEGIRNVFERESDEARSLDVDFSEGPDLFLETEPGYVFLPEPMIDLYHGQHGSRDDSDAIIPLICLGSGIPTNAEIASTDLRCIAPLVCHLLQITPGDFDLEVPTIYKTGE